MDDRTTVIPTARLADGAILLFRRHKLRRNSRRSIISASTRAGAFRNSPSNTRWRSGHRRRHRAQLGRARRGRTGAALRRDASCRRSTLNCSAGSYARAVRRRADGGARRSCGRALNSYLAKAAQRARVPYTLGTVGGITVEEAAKLAPDVLWFQLYRSPATTTRSASR